ncbi:enoyl-CoA hydratase [Sneathiella chinensis]|uniref:Enoyl-CoA hydratase n=1 Tax=Sneathiella chinensis TaxID=349750 RepID=A0ABQ5U6W5_9PROT|nr:enoyl-CoA hydratase [Sneathiella chinensis]GLQ07423.1 enoyl-CoA hydratase [Sneathiella chinensis]
MSNLVSVSLEDGIQKLTINRPDKKNALTQDMYSVLADSLHKADSDPAIRVTVITGTQDSFTSGNDLMDFLQNPGQDDDKPVVRFLIALATIKKPLIAAVNGLAVGVGTTMLLHCDLVYASDDARLSLPFVNLALVPEAASSYLLPKMCGHQKASELLLLGEPFDAKTAADIGIVNKVVAPEDLQETAMDAARKLAAKAPEAMRLSKALLKGDTEKVAAVMKQELEIFSSRLTSPEAREAMQAFMEKRPADFSKFA